MKRLVRPALAILFLAAGLAAPARAQEPVMLRYLNAPAPGEPIRRSPTLGLAVGGETHSAIMDTGSTGVVISATSIAGFESLPPLGPGRVFYSSSGRIMRGVFVEVPVTVVGADGTRLTTRPIRVLAVTRIDCARRARSCRPIDMPRRVSMLGIGFARGRADDAARNPFLNLPGMGARGEAAALARGYVVGREGVRVGITDRDREGFSLVKLRPDARTGDWEAAPVCLALEGRTPRACGTMLMDTGVTSMFLTLPDAQTEGLENVGPRGEPELGDGVSLAVSPGEGAQAPAYGFTVGDHANPVAPERVIMVRRPPGRPAFVNTTVHALNAFDYLFDDSRGEVGFRMR